MVIYGNINSNDSETCSNRNATFITVLNMISVNKMYSFIKCSVIKICNYKCVKYITNE